MKDKFKTIGEFTFFKQSSGKYSFTKDELNKTFTQSDNAIKQSLSRYRKKGKISIIRNGFYVIIPPEYSKSGILPVYLFVDDMMKWLGKKYYIALYSAAVLHGASHQQPQESYIITQNPPLRKINNNKISINFSVKLNWSLKDITEKKTDAGYIKVSSPELTALDLLYYLGKAGINRNATIIKELTEKMDKKELYETAKRYPKTSAIQRLGYLLDVVFKEKELTGFLYKAVKNKKLFYTRLSTHHKNKGEFDSKWKIIKNTDIEADI